jgi:hypothetical protein
MGEPKIDFKYTDEQWSAIRNDYRCYRLQCNAVGCNSITHCTVEISVRKLSYDSPPIALKRMFPYPRGTGNPNRGAVMRVLLTDRFVAGAKAKGVRAEFFDEKVTGLSLRVPTTGVKTWNLHRLLSFRIGAAR